MKAEDSSKIYPIPLVVSTQNVLDFYGDGNEAAGHPANFSSILFLAERLWRGPVVARRLLRWLYQSQSSLKSITHTHQRLPCTAIVTKPSGPQHTVYIYLYELYVYCGFFSVFLTVTVCMHECVQYICVFVYLPLQKDKWKVEAKGILYCFLNHNNHQLWMLEEAVAGLSIHHTSTLLYTCSQPSITCFSCMASSAWTSFPMWRAFSFGLTLVSLLVSSPSSQYWVLSAQHCQTEWSRAVRSLYVCVCVCMCTCV